MNFVLGCSYLKQSDPFVLISWFVRWIWSNVQFGANYSPLGQDVSKYSTQYWIIQCELEVFSVWCENRYYLSRGWMLGTVFPLTFSYGLSLRSNTWGGLGMHKSRKTGQIRRRIISQSKLIYGRIDKDTKTVTIIPDVQKDK